MEVLDRNTITAQEVMLENVQGIEKKIDLKKFYVIVKRFIDVCVSFIGLIVLLPIFLVISVIIKLDSKGPVFFVHKRVGKDGKEIGIYKFRTMVDNAESLIKNFTPQQKAEFESNYKLEHDPRVTKVGKFLRKSSLDELPQILNILKGDLSIIGPRPVIEKELEKYGKNAKKFVSVKPGLTGFWAANGRSDTTYAERVQMELYYIDHMSFKLDVQIFFKTIIAVIKKEGAR